MTQEQIDREFPDRLRDARVIYEQTHGMSMAQLAKITGMPKRVLTAQSRVEDWMKTVKSGQTDEAKAAILRFEDWKILTRKVAEQREAEARAAAEARRAQELAEAAKAPELKLAEPVMSDELADLLERHRREWMAPRAVSTEALKIRNTNPKEAFEKAKLAKITAETLEIVQRGERRAWGVENTENPDAGVVIIDRGGNG